MDVTQRPPEYIKINNTKYPIDYDFKTWIDISLLLHQVDSGTDDQETQSHNLNIVSQAVIKAFGAMIDESAQDILSGMVEFMHGYPKADNGYTNIEDSDGTKLYSFKHDLNYIIIAIRNQSGIDLTYRRTEPFHWWDFLLEFQTLEDSHYISKIIGYRGYKGEDKDYIKLRNIHALPQELTQVEQRALEEMNNLFYDS